MKLINGAEPPKMPDGAYENVDEECFNMCTECGEQLNPAEANDAFGTTWGTCERCLESRWCESCGDLLSEGHDPDFCQYCIDEEE